MSLLSRRVSDILCHYHENESTFMYNGAMKKKVLGFICALSLTACSSGTNVSQTEYASSPNKEFTQFLDEQFVETVESDFTTMHQLFEHPEDYGIDVDNVEVSLGEVVTTDEDRQEVEETIDELKSFDYSTLDKKQQELYDEILFRQEIAQVTYQEKYDYVTNIWDTNSGTHKDLVSFFSEYILYDEDDIEDLITLINDVPRYTQDALEYTNTQAQQGHLMIQYDTVIEDIQSTIDTQNESILYDVLYEEIDDLNLENGDDYKAQVKEALDSSFFPSYTTMKEGLEALQSQNKESQGVSTLLNETDYYEQMFKNAAGNDKDIDDVYDELNDEFTSAIRVLQKSDVDYEKLDGFTTDFESPEEIMKFLEDNYETLFPSIEIPTYTISPLDDQESSENIVAYFMYPTIDNDNSQTIRYNKRDYGDDTTGLDFYVTLAHEGIPGHMYQTEYTRENLTYDVEYIISNTSFAERYATYVEDRSYEFLDGLSDEEIEFLIANNDVSKAMICMMDIEINYYGRTQDEIVEEYGSLFGEDAIRDIYDTLVDMPTVFITYYYGYFQIQELYDYAQEELGKDFSDVEFNEALLEAGQVNFEIVERNVNDYIASK